MNFDNYEGPNDLSQLKYSDLPHFCNDLREFLITEILQQGGHFAANLGVVELCVSLMVKFPVEKHPFIWDVGHQSYPFKILTHRKNEIKNIRSFEGISGFPKISESPFDSFGTGHSSTAISAAMGMAWAKKSHITNNSQTVICIVGDGALTGGMSFEALNNIKSSQLDILIVYNDNGMGIDPNAGAIHQANPAEVKAWFEFFGLQYSGPVDGHNTHDLIEAIDSIKLYPGPKLLHVKTIKGKGYAPAELEQTKWHSAPKYVKVQPQNTATRSWHEAFGDIVHDLASTHSDIMGITPAMPSSSGLSKCIKDFPDRFIDVTIAEQHAMTFAAGIAIAGKRPIVAIYSTFLQRAYDQLIHDIAIQNLPVVISIDRAGLVGEDGPTHHGAFDLAFLLPIPNLQIYAPANEIELKTTLETALSLKKPVCIRYPKGPIPALPLIIAGPFTWLIQNVRNPILCITTGKTTELLGEIKEHLEPLNLNWLHVCQIKPIPDFGNLSQYRKIITIEDGTVIGGMGQYLEQNLKNQAQWMHLGIQDDFIPHGNNKILFELAGYGPETLLKTLTAIHRDL
jgi:1-deoxy-D-xylulose-5-phosphate synthase